MKIDQNAINIILGEARTHSAWLDKKIEDSLLQDVYKLAKMGPTSSNSSPMRIIFIKSPAAKERLKPCLKEGNIIKTMTAPVTAIIAYDTKFYEYLPKLFPHNDIKHLFAANEVLANETGFRNSSLQGAYFIIAARSLGLDCGPMSGFDKDKLENEFFPDKRYRVNFLCNIGYGDASKLHPRGPRLEFSEVAKNL